MPLPHAKDARQFYQAAKQRFEDACYLLEVDRTTGAIYLAGYGVECMLKALILSAVSARRRPIVMDTFHGAKAHEFVWLKARYLKYGGPPFPKNITRAFALVNQWAVELRYLAGAAKLREAQDFLHAAEEIMNWADGRM